MQGVEGQIDFNYLNEISGGDAEFECELLLTFVEASPPLLRDFRSGLANDDSKAVIHAVHTLKGSSRSIGGNEFAVVCESAESAARVGDLESCRSLVTDMEDAFEALKQACEAFMATAA